jgi:tetratricopeptide (TPR) repeat protein
MDLEQAVAFYKSALVGFRESMGNQHALVGGTLNNLAVLYIRRKEYDQALEMLSDALISYESAIGSGSSINPDVAQVWKNMGECYSLRGEWESALFAYSSALGVQQDARRCAETAGSKAGKPSRSAALALSGIDNVSIADTLSRLAKATAALGHYDDAIDSYEESLQFYRLALDIATKRSNGKPTQEMVNMQDRVAHTLYLIAETREKNGDFDKAIALYSEALELRLTSDAQREDQRMNMVHCAMNLAGIGSVHIRKSEFADACKVLKESIKFLEAHGEYLRA